MEFGDMKTKHVELEQFLHAFASRGFVNVSWAFLLFLVTCAKINVTTFSFWVQVNSIALYICSVSKNRGLRFSDIFFTNGWEFLIIFTHLLYVTIYARLQIFIQLSSTLTKLCHIKRDHLVHKMCSKCPPSAETFAKVVDSFVDRCLWQVIPDLLLL